VQSAGDFSLGDPLTCQVLFARLAVFDCRTAQNEHASLVLGLNATRRNLAMATELKVDFKTADLGDLHGDELQFAAPLLGNYGRLLVFQGPVTTVQCFEDNSLVREALEEPGRGRVLVVDGGGSTRCALLGDQLAVLAEHNVWSGVVVYGCVRDVSALAKTAIGVRAIATHPRKSIKHGAGQRDVAVRFADVVFSPGDYLYSDEDGMVVSARPLLG
jgi:regulator of ribonuclease activity A